MLVLAVFAACAEHKEAPQKGALGQGVYVDEAWTTARDVTGHRIHVVKQTTARNVTRPRPRAWVR